MEWNYKQCPVSKAKAVVGRTRYPRRQQKETVDRCLRRSGENGWLTGMKWRKGEEVAEGQSSHSIDHGTCRNRWRTRVQRLKWRKMECLYTGDWKFYRLNYALISSVIFHNIFILLNFLRRTTFTPETKQKESKYYTIMRELKSEH